MHVAVRRDLPPRCPKVEPAVPGGLNHSPIKPAGTAGSTFHRAALARGGKSLRAGRSTLWFTGRR
jgi:hypothetical protein